LEDVDSDSIAVSIDKSLKIDQDIVATHESRLSFVENVLGIDTSEGGDGTGGGGTTTPIVTDSEAFGLVIYSQDTIGTLNNSLTFKWRIVSVFGDTVVERPVTISKNVSSRQILNILIYSVIINDKGRQYMRDFRVDDDAKILFRFKDIYVTGEERPKFEIEITETFDGADFQIIQ